MNLLIMFGVKMILFVICDNLESVIDIFELKVKLNVIYYIWIFKYNNIFLEVFVYCEIVFDLYIIMKFG